MGCCVFGSSFRATVGAFLLLVGAAFAEAPVARDALLSEGKSLYSLGKEERIIRHFFQDKRGGVFVDVGAYHWKEASTTLYLEEYLGWSGIAVDAQERYAAGYEKNRPGTRFSTYLVTGRSGDIGTLYFAGPLSSTDKDHLESFPSMEGFEAPTMRVPTITLDDLLEQNDLVGIDFLSIDIEGAEVDALLGFDIERFHPALVCIEVARKNRASVSAYFEAHGYERIKAYLPHDVANWYYAPKKKGALNPLKSDAE